MRVEAAPARMTMHYRSFLRFVAAVLMLCWAGMCAAEDAVPPPWRGSAGSTLQDWMFLTNANPAELDAVSNSFGVPSAVLAPGPHSSGWLNYYPVMGPRIGYWSLGAAGTITCTLPDAPGGSQSRRDIWVQVTYFEDITQAPAVEVNGATRLEFGTQTVEPRPTGGAWKTDWSRWSIESQNPNDTVVITSSASWGALVDEVVIDTRAVALTASVAEAKQLSDGTPCEITGAVVTRSFGSFFYVEDASRAAGIRVNCASGEVPAAEDTAPVITGVIRTIDGERVIDEAAVEAGGVGHVAPLGMCNRAITTGLSPLGLLVTLWGRAEVASPDANEFWLSDGSPQPVRVLLYEADTPGDGDRVSISGVLGVEAGAVVLRSGPGDMNLAQN